MTRRIRIHIGVGDLLETAGAGLACFAVAHLAGLFWALLLAALFLIIAGNLIYGHTRLVVALPSRAERIRVRWLLATPWRKARGLVVQARELVRS